METETPETDAKHHEIAQLDCSDLYRYRHMQLHARKLERDLNKCQAALVKLDQIYRAGLCNEPVRPEWIAKWIPMENS